MADDDFDRPHYHVFASDEYVGAANLVDLDVPCNDDHNSPTAVVVVALDDYRQLVAAARDRHPTNHQPGRAVLGSADSPTDPDCCPTCGSFCVIPPFT